ncbi:hypothetical protein J6590_028662 [Homalodisca vitripennis]|nr:hypothetical protein J6590_028662 [Homalodisca vitripennis]
MTNRGVESGLLRRRGPSSARGLPWLQSAEYRLQSARSLLFLPQSVSHSRVKCTGYPHIAPVGKPSLLITTNLVSISVSTPTLLYRQ